MRTALLVLASVGASLAASPWDPKFRAQAEATLALMTAEQKFTMVHGSGGGYVGDVPAITLSNGVTIPPINLEDGPQGVADGVSRVTAWPSALTVVQSWDTEAMYAYGYAMGQEQWRKGTNVMLGPGVNLARVPWCGRNFEYQGEDPHLAGKMVGAEVRGIQANNISACVKHYVRLRPAQLPRAVKKKTSPYKPPNPTQPNPQPYATGVQLARVGPLRPERQRPAARGKGAVLQALCGGRGRGRGLRHVLLCVVVVLPPLRPPPPPPPLTAPRAYPAPPPPPPRRQPRERHLGLRGRAVPQ